MLLHSRANGVLQTSVWSWRIEVEKGEEMKVREVDLRRNRRSALLKL